MNAIPIIGYHDIDDNKTITNTDVNLFDAEMKYLHDNGLSLGYPILDMMKISIIYT